ncbi:MAG: aminotransferase class I/II-fold pyridoxal phosphate-dependent enzyme [Bacteroidales bacterium]|nr:aminotransferase class I/II-fold pyridoxal phosphate-dependent enzyme [Bacteroidales bacterium]
MSIKAASRLESIQEYYFSRKLKEIEKMNSEGADIINLGIGNPDLPPSEASLAVAGSTLLQDNAHGYQSYRAIPELRSAFSNWYKTYYGVSLDPDKEILPLMGSKEGIFHISMAFLEPGDEVLVPDPGYPTYSSVTKLVGGILRPYELSEENDWFPDFESLEQSDLSKVKIMWVNYPHMPTGTKPTEKLFRDLVAFGLRNEILICHDNPYSFILNENPTSILEVENSKDIVLELNSLSKSHNMAGWRVGMLAGSEKHVSIVMKVLSNIQSGMFLPVQKGAVEALSNPPAWYEKINRVYESRRETAWQILDLLDCQYEKDQSGLFIWARLPNGSSDSIKFTDVILEKSHVFITPGSIFGNQGKSYIRISLCSKKEVLEQAKSRILKQI